jgi:hypothetical protein
MPSSAYLFPISTRLDWDRARVPDLELTPVDPDTPLDVGEYAARDGELAYRDLVVAAAISRVALKVSDVWGFAVGHPVLAASPEPNLDASGTDVVSAPSSPGNLTYVDNQSVAFDAVTTDQQLYARDLVVYQALYLAAAQHLVSLNPLNPITSLAISVTDAWSFSSSVEQEVSVGYNLPFNPSLFKCPDQHLAWRDNVLAGYVARLKESLGKIWSQAQRVLIRVVDDNGSSHEPETYALISDDGRYRTWAAAPRLPNQLLLTYDRTANTVGWVGERPGIAGSPQVAESSVVVGGALVIREPDFQAPGDSEYYRQKSARLHTQYFLDQTIYLTYKPQNYILTGGVYQLDSALLTVPALATFALPTVVPAGCVRVGLLVRPAISFSILGFQNTAGLSDGTGVTITTAQTLTWNVALPAGTGRLYYSLSLTDKSNKTPAFAVRVKYNSTVIFDGAYVFNKDPGEIYETQSVGFETDAYGRTASFSVEWLGGEGELTIESINFSVNTAEITANYGLGVQLNSLSSRQVQFLGVAERLDVVLFDIVVPTELVNPTLTVNWRGGGSLALFIHGFDLKVFDLVEQVSDSSDYEAYKASLLKGAGSAVAAVYHRYAASNPTAEFRQVDDLHGYVWNSTCYLNWLTALKGAGESRLESAFQLAGPADLGRPALIPEGLEVVEGATVKANYGVNLAVPVLRALQPWMLAFGARVAGPDFWPLNHPGCTWYGPLSTISVDPDFEISSTLGNLTVPHITNVTMTQVAMGAPAITGNRAYTMTNSGPAGGTISQTVNYTIWMNNLRIGSVYTLTISIITATLAQHIEDGTLTTFDLTFVASAVTESHSPAAITAALGYQIWLQGAVLS